MNSGTAGLFTRGGCRCRWCHSQMCWGPEPGSGAAGSHSLGCSVHRSRRPPEGWRRSAAAGCLPEDGGQGWTRSETVLETPSGRAETTWTHLENLLIEESGSEHSDAVGVDLGLVASGQGAGHLLLAVQQQSHVFLGNGESNAMPPRGRQRKCINKNQMTKP